MFYTLGMEQGKRFLLWRKEKRKARDEFPHHLKTVSQDRSISASGYWGGMDLGANRSLRLRLIS